MLLHETSVDEGGRICFYGSTSLYHLEPAQNVQSNGGNGMETTSPYDYICHDESPQHLSTSLPATSPLSHDTRTSEYMMLDAGVPVEVCNELLDIYWCWPHHLHLVLSRKIFMRKARTYPRAQRLTDRNR
jgi:hypothetical protein